MAILWRGGRPLPNIPTTPHEWSKRKRLAAQLIGGLSLGLLACSPLIIAIIMRVCN